MVENRVQESEAIAIRLRPEIHSQIRCGLFRHLNA